MTGPIKIISVKHSSNNGKNIVTRNFEYNQANLTGTLALKVTSREKIELEIIHILIQTDVSRHNNTIQTEV